MDENPEANIYEQPVDHARLTQIVQQFVDSTTENVLLAARDRNYYDGHQISEHTLEELRRRGQPAIHNNKIRLAVDGILGVLDNSQTDPEAMPRNYSGQDAADVCTKTLRYVCDRAEYSRLRSGASSNFLIQGWCAAQIGFDHKVTGDQIEWDEFIYDPYSRDLDFRDARWLGVAKMVEMADAYRLYPKLHDLNPSADIDQSLFGDIEKKKVWWIDGARKRLRVIDLYYLAADGEWHRMVFCRAGMLHAGPSAYHDDEGATFCPIVATSFNARTSDNTRYGIVRDMIPLQDEVNSRRSRLLHLANHRQTRQTDQFAPPANKEEARREASKADGTIPFGWEPIQSSDLSQGQMLIFQQTMADLDRMAPTPAVLGRTASSNESGRARQMLQQAGLTELARPFSRFEAFELAIYRRMWWIAREYMDGKTIIRITDDPRAPQFLTINEPVMGPVMRPVMDPQTGQQMIHPLTGQPHAMAGIGQVGTNNKLAELDMDIILTTVPDHVTLQQEVFATLMEYASANKLTPFDPNFWAMIEMSPMPDKRETIERLKNLKAEADQEAAPQQQAAAQAAQAQQQSEQGLAQAKAAKDGAQAQKAQVEALRIAHQLPLDHLTAHSQAMQAQASAQQSMMPNASPTQYPGQ